MSTPQLHHQSGESRLRANSSAVVSSRRSSSLATNNSLAGSPTRKGSRGSDDPANLMLQPMATTVVNWRGRSRSVDCRVLTKTGVGHVGLVDELAAAVYSAVPTSPSLSGAAVAGIRRTPPRPRASISGVCCTYSLDRRPSNSSNEANQIEMRQRSQTFSEVRLTATLLPSANPAAAASLRCEMVPSSNPVAISGSSHNSGSSSHATACTPAPAADRSRSKKRRPSSTTAAAAAAAAAVAAAELKALNHPLAYPSLDFFDIGLEDYGRRSTTSSFSRFIQQQPSLPPPAAIASSAHHQPPVSHVHVQQQSAAGRRRRTCSFSKVLSRGSKHPSISRWPTVFGSGKQQEMDKNSASSMPSVQQIPSLVTAV